MTRGVLVVGSGKRVREAALPALLRLGSDFDLRGVVARSAKTVEAGGTSHAVAALEALDDPATYEGVDLIYLAVTKDAVPSVLARLTARDASGVDLLIDTPVVRFKHFRHVERLESFRHAWVAEDCTTLPWLPPVRSALEAGAIGKVEGVLFYQSAYAYHGLATAKAVLDDRRVRRGRRRRLAKGLAQRELTFAGGGQAWMLEPRDYGLGRLAILGSEGSIADFDHDGPGHLTLAPVLRGEDCVALRLGQDEFPFDDDEIALLAGDPPEAGLTARMDGLKRVGFLRLLRSIAAGDGAYPVEDALDDMVVDYHLEKFGRYRATPFTESRAPLARGLLKLATRLGG